MSGVPAERLRATVFSDLERALDRGTLAPEAFFGEIERRAGISVPLDVWTAAWRDIFEPIPESLDLVSRRKPGVRAALVSNTNALHWDGVLRVAPDIERLVDVLALSFQIGVSKPDAEIFDFALGRLGAERHEAVFADDRTELVDAARALGIDAFVVDSPATLARELAARDIV